MGVPRLWYISDGERGTGGRPLAEVVESAQGGGVEAVVVRERALETAALARLLEALLPLRERGLRILVSRRLDLARAFGLDGVQLAADSIGVADARHWLGRNALIGYSAHSAAEARTVAREGADCVTLSPIFPTESKPDDPGRGLEWLRTCIAELEIPVLGLGGVTPQRTEGILQAGAWGVAAVAALGAAPDPAAAAAEFCRAISEASR